MTTITELTQLADDLENGVGAVGAGHPSPCDAFTEDPVAYRDAARRVRAAFHRGAGRQDITATEVTF